MLKKHFRNAKITRNNFNEKTRSNNSWLINEK